MGSGKRRVMIVGAGIIGSSIAWRLAQAGAEVTLIDAGRLGGEASWAGAGMLAPGGEFDRESVWTRLSNESMDLYPAFVEELSRESGVPIDYRVCGAVEYAFSDGEWEQLIARAEAQRGLGIESRIEGRSVMYPAEAQVDPRDVTRALRCACLRRGAKVIEDKRVDEFDCDEIDAVVIAAGAWSSEIAICYRGELVALPRTFPIKGHLIGFDLPAGSIPHIAREGHTYVLQRSNGFTIAGSTNERAGFDRAIDPALCEEIHRRAARVCPVLEEIEPSERWIGFRPATDSEEPALGRAGGTNVWLAYGHYRNGILLAPVTAKRVAGEIIDSLIQ